MATASAPPGTRTDPLVKTLAKALELREDDDWELFCRTGWRKKSVEKRMEHLRECEQKLYRKLEILRGDPYSFFAPIENQHQLLEADLMRIKKWFAKRAPQRAQYWIEFTADPLSRLDEVQGRLSDLLELPRVWYRREAIKVGVTAAAVAAAGTFLGVAKSIGSAPLQPAQSSATGLPAPAGPSSTASNQSIPPVPPGLYLQVMALSTLEAARQFAQSGKDLVVHQAFVPPQKSDRAPFKVLLKQRFESFEKLKAKYQELKAKGEIDKGGMIEVFANRSTDWLKTLEEAIIEESVRPDHATSPYRPIIVEALGRYPLRKELENDVRLVEAIISIESRGNARARSRAGAMGLMQVMPRNWKHFHFGSKEATQFLEPRYHKTYYIPLPGKKGIKLFRKVLKAHTCDEYDPKQNIDAGVMILADFFRRYYRSPADLKPVLERYNAGRPIDVKENREYAGKVGKAGGT
jgi:soluble lytic murein transglycosylase-like protein